MLLINFEFMTSCPIDISHVSGYKELFGGNCIDTIENLIGLLYCLYCTVSLYCVKKLKLKLCKLKKYQNGPLRLILVAR